MKNLDEKRKKVDISKDEMRRNPCDSDQSESNNYDAAKYVGNSEVLVNNDSSSIKLTVDNNRSSSSSLTQESKWAKLQSIPPLMQIIFHDMLGIFNESYSPSDSIFVQDSIPFLISNIYNLWCLKRKLFPTLSFNKYYSFKYFYDPSFTTKVTARQTVIKNICNLVVDTNFISAFEPKAKGRQVEFHTNGSVLTNIDINSSLTFPTQIEMIREQIREAYPDSSDIDKEFSLISRLFLDLLGNIHYKFNIKVTHIKNLARASGVYDIKTRNGLSHYTNNDESMKVYVKINESSTNENLFLYIKIGEIEKIKFKKMKEYPFEEGLYWSELISELQRVRNCFFTNKFTDAFNNKSSERVK